MELDPQLVEKIKNYRPDPAKLATVKDEPLLSLTAASGSGKGALIKNLLKLYPADYHLFVSHTNRQPRMNDGVMERDGVEYHFIDANKLQEMVDSRDFIEVKGYVSKAYGTSVQELKQAQAEAKIAVNDIEIQGADEYQKLGLNIKSVFILPPSFEEWMRRLKSRGTLPKEEEHKRLQTAVEEIEHALNADYFYLVINDELDAATKTVHAIAQGKIAEKRPAQAVKVAQDILAKTRQALN